MTGRWLSGRKNALSRLSPFKRVEDMQMLHHINRKTDVSIIIMERLPSMKMSMANMGI